METKCAIQVSLIAYKEAFISYNGRIKKAKDQDQDLIIRVAKLQRELIEKEKTKQNKTGT